MRVGRGVREREKVGRERVREGESEKRERHRERGGK